MSTVEAARAALAAGDYARAVQIATAVVAANPNDIDAWHWLGVAHLLAGDTASALPMLQRAADAMPSIASYHANLAEALRRAGRADDALAAADRALALDASHDVATRNRAAALFDLGRFDAALATYRHALAARPHDADILAFRADCLRELGDLARARRGYDAALAIDPNHVHALANLAPLLLLFGDVDGALATSERAVAADDSSALAWMNLGLCRFRLELFESAMDAYAEAWERDTTSAELCCRIGDTWQAVGDLEQAAMWFDRAEEREPASRRVRACAAALLLEGGQNEEALARYDALVAEAEDDAELRVGRAKARWEEGDAQGALADFRHAAAVRPQLAHVHCSIGDVLASIGDIDGAIAAQRAALAINPRQPAALAGLATTLRGALPTEDAAAAQALLRESWLGEGAASAVHAGLAHHFDGIGDYAAAAYHAAEGNRLFWETRTRRGWSYSNDEHRADVDRLIETYTPELFARTAGFGDADARPVFIVGMPRSGTTLTEQILAGHSRVLGVGEKPHAGRSLRALGTLLGAESATQAIARADRESVGAIGVRYRATLDREIEKAGRAPDSIARVVDKMPDNYLLLGWLAILFPRARFVHLRRDPRDIALSCWMQRFGQIRWAFDMDHIAARLVEHQRVMAHWRRVLPTGIYEVDYEALVAAPEANSRALIEWLGLDWEPGCLAFQRNANVVRTASVTQVRQPVYRTSVARWRHYAAALEPVLALFPAEPSAAGHL